MEKALANGTFMTGVVSLSSSDENLEKKTVDSKATWKNNREKKLKFTYQEQREYETIDEEIVTLERGIEKLEQEMLTFATQYTKLAELTKNKEELEKQLEEKMERWVYLNDLAERIANGE